MERFWSLLGGLSLVACWLFLGVLFFKHQNQVKGLVSYSCAQRVVLIDNGKIEEREAFSLTKEEFFDQIGLKVYPEDKVFESLPFNLCQGLVIKIQRAPLIYLDIGGKQKEVRSWQPTVKDLLREQKIVLGTRDRVEPSLSAKISTGMRIRVIRVGERIEHKEISLSFVTQRKPDPNLVKGKARIVQEGKKGKKIVTYKVITENGRDVRWVRLEEKIVSPPKPRIIAYGTKPRTTYLATGQAKWYIITPKLIGACNLVPKGTRLLVTNLDNGRSVEIVASGWGAFGYPTVVDLSSAAFEALGGELWQGVLPRVKVEKINE